MTLFHFGNCVALAYFPYFILYKCSGLDMPGWSGWTPRWFYDGITPSYFQSYAKPEWKVCAMHLRYRSEYSAFWRCVQAACIYLVTQLCKMLVLATFFPTSESTADSLDVFAEFLKSTVDVADLFGLYLTMSKIPGKGELKVLVAGLGWATAELVMTKLLPLWVGARGIEFDWKYMQMSFDANIALIHHIATATLVWLWSRHDLQRSFLPVLGTFMALSCFKPLIIQFISFSFGIISWNLLLLKTAFTGCVGIVALQIYLGLTIPKSNRL